MKYLKQIIIILIVCFVGELLNYILPIPVPAGIYGMVILFLLLFTGVLKLDQVEDTADFLLDIMPLLFVPSAVGIIEESERLKQVWLQIVIITIVTTAIVMAVSGRVTQWLVRHLHPRNDSSVKKDSSEDFFKENDVVPADEKVINAGGNINSRNGNDNGISDNSNSQG